MNIKTAVLTAAAVAAAGALADPQVSNVNATQSSSRAVTVTYDLTEEAIVTVDVQTNFVVGMDVQWVSIGEENFSNVAGDVNRLVAAGNGRTIGWKPGKSWPNRTVDANGMRFVVSAWQKTNPPDYMVIELDGSKTVNYYVSTNALPEGGLANDIYRTDKLVMRRCPAAGVTWWMGSPTDEPGFESAGSTETRHKVMLTHDFYIGIFELTQGQVTKVGYQWNNSRYKVDGAVRPFDNTWYGNLRGTSADGPGSHWPDADPDVAHGVDGDSQIAYFRNATGVRLDLPTEAQWEFACRAGTGTGLNSGKNLTNDGSGSGHDANLAEVARCYATGGGAYWDIPTDSDTSKGTAKVGSYKPNAWGIYDMHGNDAEVCLDWFQADLGLDQVTDPVGPATGAGRVLRGGAYASSKNAALRSAARSQASAWAAPTYGCRLCLTLY